MAKKIKKPKADIGIKIPNYNDSKVKVGPNFVGMGSNKGGTAYNGAWGGTMQNGGELPLAYNPSLSKKDKEFQNWFKKNTIEGQRNIPYSDKLDYDYYSFFKNKGVGNIENHFPDTYKRPNHPTFSNESIYSTPENPGGQWDGEKFNKKGKFQFQMGGNLPGMTGNMYARQGAPSNGKYAKKTKPSAQNGKEMKFFQDGLDFKPKSMQMGGDLQNLQLKVALQKERQFKRDSVFDSLKKQYPQDIQFDKLNQAMLNYYQQEPKQYSNLDPSVLTPLQKTKLLKKAKGGVIKDDMGQWAHPGKVTEINSNKITMQDVPYPVLGVSDVGHQQLMLPNQDYQFQGSKVTEYPLNEITKGGKQDKGQKKKLVQLTDFSNNNNMEQGKLGIHINPKNKDKFNTLKKKTSKKLKHAQWGDLVPSEQNQVQLSGQTNLNTQYNLLPNPNQNINFAKQTQQLSGGFQSYGQYQGEQAQAPQQMQQKSQGGGGLLSSAAGAITSNINNVIGGFEMLDQERNQLKQAKQFSALSNVVAKASETRPEKVKRKYVRPEDQVISANNLFPSQGVGTNYLAKNGVEIQNTYAPNTLYENLEYEPLNDSGKKKKYQMGGFVTQFGADAIQAGQQVNSLGQGIGGSLSGNKGMTPSGGSMLGSTFGFAGGIIGGLLDQTPKEIKKYQEQGTQNMNRAALQGSIQNTQLQNSAFMKEGGWVSNDWLPQVITKFGDHSLKDLLKPDPTMNTLRSGGHLKEDYVQPTERALQTYALGGELQVHDGGYAEPISQNPYLPDGGETVMFRGKSHENGGMPITFGKNPVEVEGGEPAVKLPDESNGHDNLVVFGNMKIPNYGVNKIGDKDAKGKKFKTYIADLSKKEDKQNKTINKGITLVNENDTSNPFDMLKMNSGKAMLEGGNMHLKEIARKKQMAATVQNAILETAQEHGLDSDALSQGKIKKMKASEKAQFGASIFGKYADKISKEIPAADTVKYINDLKYSRIQDNPNVLHKQTTEPASWKKGAQDYETWFAENYPKNKGKIIDSPYWGKQLMEMGKPSVKEDYVGVNTPFSSGYTPMDFNTSLNMPKYKGSFRGTGNTAEPPIEQPVENKIKGFGWGDALSQILPYFRPTNQIPLDPNQLSGEMYALASNQLDPVQAQLYRPVLDQPYDISLQDQLNANQADFNGVQRQTAYNPAAQSVLAAQKYAANSHVLGEQFRLNQANKAGIFSKNRDTLNDAQLKNLAILDQQYTRQSQAKSNTKAIAQQALTSIGDKIAQNKLENRTLGVYENLYNYRYDNQGRAFNLNAPAQFNIPQIVPTKEEKKKSRNGAIVKAIKSL